MERKIIKTLDGSTTIQIVDWNECYHSKMGAIQEAVHVFIKNGLYLLDKKNVSILEIGFGTGLNAFITFLEAQKNDYVIEYSGVEAYPISAEELHLMNYVEELNAGNYKDVFDLMHQSIWEERQEITPNFTLTKYKMLFEDIKFTNRFDIIYFDAFGFQVQPELWSEAIFNQMFAALKSSGVLVTYAARGVVKRNMIQAGFTVKKVPGPPGKREMMIGFKNFLENI